MDSEEGSVRVRLDEMTVHEAYERNLQITTSRPNCETNWKRYFSFELPWDEIWSTFLRPGIYTPHHFMTFFKVLHRALPTNTRFQGDHSCRLGCGHTEHFAHWSGGGCRQLRKFWREVTRMMTSFGCGRYRPTKVLIFFTLRWVEGKLEPINRHMRGLIWLAWKFAWQQLAEIGQGAIGRLDIPLAIKGMLGMHHTAVLAALCDYRLVQQEKRAGARKFCKKDQEEAETYRVWPFVNITASKQQAPKFQYTKVYWDLLEAHGINRPEDVDPPA